MVDGHVWHTWPKRLSVAAMEWVTSWCFFRSTWDRLAIHGASASPSGSDFAIVFPGDSGAGKSTLSSTLMMSDWRLLSDEVALVDYEDASVVGLGRPTILKGDSIDLIGERFPDRAVFGPEGWMRDPPMKVAHLQPTRESVDCSGKLFRIGAFVFPKREGDRESGPELEPLSAQELFVRISQLGINYRLVGEAGYRLAVHLARCYPAYDLRYRDAGEAEALLRTHQWPAVKTTTTIQSAAIVSGSSRSDSHDKETPSFAVIANIVPGDDSGSVPPSVSETLSTVGAIFRSPAVAGQLSEDQWGSVLLLANHTELLPQIAERVLNCKGDLDLPACVHHRFLRERQLNGFNRLSIEFELDELERLLGDMACPLVLLKGCAYLKAGLRWADGRRSGDVDLLVREQDVERVSEKLLHSGFEFDEELDPRDASYFRRWLHELPPVHHNYRKKEIDLHFRLLPQCDPNSFSSDSLIDRSIAIQGSVFRWLDPVDRIIHAAINLGRTGEYRRALRDLWDIQSLIQDAGGTDHYCWVDLADRSRELGVQKTVSEVLLLAEQAVGLVVPDEFVQRIGVGSRHSVRRRITYRTMCRAAIPSHLDLRSRQRRRAMWLMEHYPLPKLQTWLDPLTWTKRIGFIHGD
jgi:hypothetical protein